MKKTVRKRKLVGRLFVVVELKPTPANAATPGCLHEIEIENTTTILTDAFVHSKVLEGVPDGATQSATDIQHQFTNLLDAPVRKSQLVAWSADLSSVKVHTHKVVRKYDDDPDWIEDLLEPIIEVTGKA